MSAEIKIAGSATPRSAIKYNGKCYKLVSAALTGQYDITTDDVEGFYDTCAECQAAGNVPSTCPCASWGTFPCGAEDDQIVGSYDIAIANWRFYNYTPAPVALDATLWDGYNAFVAGYSCGYNGSSAEGVRVTSTPLVAVQARNSRISLLRGVAWEVSIWNDSENGGIWIKTDGATPEGTYTLIPWGAVHDVRGLGGYIANRTVSPTTIEVTAHV